MSLTSSVDIELSVDEAKKRVKLRRKLDMEVVNLMLDETNTRLNQLMQWSPGFDHARDLIVGDLNPPLWEIGHIALFYEHFCLRWLTIGGKEKFKPCLENTNDEFNSFAVPKDQRYVTVFQRQQIFNWYRDVFDQCKEMLSTHPDCSLARYVAALTAMHQDMHCESLLFSMQVLGETPKLKFPDRGNPISLPISTTSDPISTTSDPIATTSDPHSKSTQSQSQSSSPQPSSQNSSTISSSPMPTVDGWCDIEGGCFMQGWNLGESPFLEFDNECPAHSKTVKSFSARSTCVVESEMLEFVMHGGYTNKDLWKRESPTGWLWRTKHDATLPKYWEYRNDGYYRRRFDEWIKISDRTPVVGVSYYEADAFCAWKGWRLPSETEWEYMATNGGRTVFPWGSQPVTSQYANVDFDRGDVVDVCAHHEGDNQWGVKQLIGNVWEWTTSPLFPYDGFVMDPIYREFTYPFMGFQNVARGGSWAVPARLINSKYRYARPKECNYEFFGFRPVRDCSNPSRDDTNNDDPNRSDGHPNRSDGYPSKRLKFSRVC